MLQVDFSRLTRLARRIRGCFSLVRHPHCPEQKECFLLNNCYPFRIANNDAEHQYCELHAIPVLRAPLPESDELLLGELTTAFAVLSQAKQLGNNDDLPSNDGYELARELTLELVDRSPESFEEEQGHCQGANC